jgi:cell division protein FtsB
VGSAQWAVGSVRAQALPTANWRLAEGAPAIAPKGRGVATATLRTSIRWDRVGRYALLSTLLVILLLYISPALHWLAQSRTGGEQREELRDLTRENRSLKQRVRQLRDPRALEREARKLGLVRQGERAYVIEGLPRR